MLNSELIRLTESVEKLEMAVKNGGGEVIAQALRGFVSDCKDPISDWLDVQYGATVTDNAIFSALPRHWEEEFHKDMDALNVSPSRVAKFFSKKIVIWQPC